MPTTGHLVLLILAILLFAAGGLISLARVWWEKESLRIAAKACLWSGVTLSLATLIWHAAIRTVGNWLPLEDNFEAFLWLAILLALFVLYVQRTRPLAGLDWFVMPMVIVLLLLAVIFGRTKPQPYVDTTWSWVHRITSYGGAVAFAIAGAAGALYLLTNRKLRRKAPPTGLRYGSLERLESITFSSVTLGFALLSVGLVTGVVYIVKAHGDTRLGPNWLLSPKVLLTAAVWLVYAVVLHSPINPSFRGRKVAVLSIVGCVLMVGTLVAVQLVPGGR
jgi:ABC-type uncharacterized transport system permease subunit